MMNKKSMQQLHKKITFYKQEMAKMQIKLDALENRHQSDCIEINQLNTALEVILDKYQRLKEIKGL